jgi:hypothetical protein
MGTDVNLKITEILYLWAVLWQPDRLRKRQIWCFQLMFSIQPSLVVLIVTFSFLLACHAEQGGGVGDQELARVYNKKLMRSEAQLVLPEDTPPEDSALIVRAYVQRWVYDQLLMYEAERNIPQDLNIDQLVREYRASLVRFNFEQQIIAEKLDSTISEAELSQFYENNKDQFLLESTILKALLIKIPKDRATPAFQKLWNDRMPGALEGLRAHSEQHATIALLDDEKWYTLEELTSILPPGSLSTQHITANKEYMLNSGNSKYYFRIMKVIKSQEPAPLEFAKEQASKIILHRRKQQLLEQWKEQLYQKELRRENIKLFL